MAKKQAASFIQKLNPLNLVEEREKFFFDPQYNPQFEYLGEIDEEEYHKYGPISDDHLDVAMSILQRVVKKWGNEDNYTAQTDGRILSQSESEAIIREYLVANGVEGIITLRFSPQYLSRTSVQQNILRIRVPVQYREHSILGMLNHEIGTHVFRRLNEEKQPWFKNHKKFNFHPYLETEEGLAVLHSQIPLPDKHLWGAALNYVAVYQASRLSFAELYAFLKQFVASREIRWSTCLKAKRGVTDTAIPGGYSKNQVYLRGAISVANWLVRNDFAVDHLYIGKIALEDTEVAGAVNQVPEPRLPLFLQNADAYRKHIKTIIRTNNLPFGE